MLKCLCISMTGNHFQGWAGVDSLAMKVSRPNLEAFLCDALGVLHVSAVVRSYIYQHKIQLKCLTV